MSDITEAEAEFFIVDLRPEWNGNPYITFWRPNDAGYAYPLPWSGRYTERQVVKGGEYYTQRRYHDGRGRVGIWQRFAVRCDAIEAMAEPPDTEGRGRIDGNTGPVVRNSGKVRTKLRRLRFVSPPPSPETSR